MSNKKADFLIDKENYLNINIVRKFLVEKFGEDILVLINYLKNMDYVSEEEITRDTQISIKSLQKMLIRMQDQDIIDCKKLIDDTGFITYFWKLDENRLLEYINKNLLANFDEIKSRLEYGEELYYCESCSVDKIDYYDYEESLNLHFKCPKCGSELSILTPEIIDNIKKRILE